MPAAPQARYILPSFIEHSSFGVKESNPYNKLFEERIIFLGVQVDDASANDVMAQLLVLESLDPDRDITMYINSPGGCVHLADGDLRHHAVRAGRHPDGVPGPGRLGRGGAAGRGYARVSGMALPNARILIHQPSLAGVIQGQFSDLEIQAAEIERMRTLMETTLAHHTGKDAAVDPQGHRPGQDPDRRGGQGVRDHRHRPGVPQALGVDGLTGCRAGPVELAAWPQPSTGYRRLGGLTPDCRRASAGSQSHNVRDTAARPRRRAGDAKRYVSAAQHEYHRRDSPLSVASPWNKRVASGTTRDTAQSHTVNRK